MDNMELLITVRAAPTGGHDVCVDDCGDTFPYVGHLETTAGLAGADRAPNGGVYAFTPDGDQRRFDAKPRKGRGRTEARKPNDGMRAARGRAATWLVSKWLATPSGRGWLDASGE